MAGNPKANVFALEASISIDTTNFKNKISEIKNAGLAMQQVMEKDIKSVKALQQFLNDFDTKKFKDSVKGIKDSAKGIGDEVDKDKDKIDDLGDSSEDSADKSKSAFSSLKDSIGETVSNFGKITAVIEKITDSIKKMAETAVQAFKIAVKAGEEFTKGIVEIVDKSNEVENKLALTFGGAGAAVGTYAFAKGKDFESSMASVIATMGVDKDYVDEKGNNIYEMLKKAAEDAGASTMFTSKDAADALLYLTQSGYDAYSSIEMLPTVLDVAKAGGMDLAYTARQLAIVKRQVAKSGVTLSQLGDMLITTANNSSTSVQELMEAFPTAAGSIRNTQMDISEVFALLGTLANANYRGSEGGTLARNILKNLYTPTNKAKLFMEDEKNNLSRTYDNGQVKSLRDFLDDMGKVLENFDPDTAGIDTLDFFAEIFDVRNISAATALVHDKESWDKITEAVSNCEDRTLSMASTMSDTLVGDMKSATSRLEALGLDIYDAIVIPLRDAVTQATTYMAQLHETIDEYGISVGAFHIGDIADESLEKNTPSIIDFMDKAETVARRFLQGFSDNLPNIAKNISAIILKFGEIRDKIFNSVVDLFAKDENSTALVDIGTTILDTMLTTAENFTGTLAENLPQFIDKMAVSLSENKDSWTKSITTIIKNISDLIVKSAPALVESGGVLLVAILEGMATTTTEITKILPQILDEFSKLLSDKEFSEDIQLAFKQIIGDIGDIIVTLVKFMAESDNLDFFTELLESIFTEITNTIDECAPELMAALEKISEKIGQFLGEELFPFVVTVRAIGAAIGTSFAVGLWNGLWAGLSNIFPFLKMLGINNDAAGELFLPDEENYSADVNTPIADIINQLPYDGSISEEDFNKLIEQYKNSNNIPSDYLDEYINGDKPISDLVSQILAQNNSSDYLDDYINGNKPISDLVSQVIGSGTSSGYGGTFQQGIATSAKNIIANMDFSWVQDIGTKFITNLAEGISSGWESVKSSVLGIFKIFNLSDKVEAAKPWGSALINTIAGGFVSKWEEWKGPVTSVFKSFNLSKISSDSHKWGADLIDNFSNGVTEKSGSLFSVITTVASGIRERLGFSEPEIGPLSDFHTYAPDMVSLFAGGIKSNAGLIYSEVDSLAGNIKSGLSNLGVYNPVDFGINDITKYSDNIIPANIAKQAPIQQGVTIQNLNINVDGTNIESDYDVDRFVERMSDKAIETISERLKMLDIFSERAVGGAAW